MLKYLIIQVDDCSTSFCHYNNENANPRLIDITALRKAVFMAMTENLSLQVVYPGYKLPDEYAEVLNTVDSVKIVPASTSDSMALSSADIIVFNRLDELSTFDLKSNGNYLLRCTSAEMYANASIIKDALARVKHLGIVNTDVEAFNETEIKKYSLFLKKLIPDVAKSYATGSPSQTNLLTDRMLLDGMNNCNAGAESITLGPDGKFYVCPAFYLDKNSRFSVGDLISGVDIKNPQLYRLDHAPICRRCDAWQCRRCIWLNKKLTLEVNTPGRQQCLKAHVERNATRELLAEIRKIGEFMPEKEIPEIDYLDPYDKLINN